MQIKKRIYPYPILNKEPLLSTYDNKSFEMVFSPHETSVSMELNNIHFKTDSQYLNSLYDQDKLTIVCVVECSSTVFRRCFKLGKSAGQTITLNYAEFEGLVFISCYGYANENLVLDSNEFDDDYKKIKYEIEKYDILVADDGFNIKITHSEEEQSLVKSIFSIISSETITDDTYKIDYESNKITISLSEENYNKYLLIYSIPSKKEVFFNMLLVPVLTEAFTKCIDDVKNDLAMEIDDIINRYPWFSSVLKGYKKLYGVELSMETMADFSAVVFAQELLGKPLGKALGNIIDEINNINKENEDNE